MSFKGLDEAALGRVIAQLTTDAVICTDLDGSITAWNPAAERIYGWSAAEAIGQSIELIVPAFRLDEEARLRQCVVRGEVIRDVETVRRRRDDTLVSVSWTLSPLCGPTGKPASVLIVTKDLSGGEGHDRASRRLAAIVESSDDAIISKDLNGIVASWNVAAERVFGYSAEEMIGTSIRVLIPEERQGEEDETLAKIRRGERLEHFETVRRRKDGSLLPISLTVSPILDGDGRVIGASKIARDITLLKAVQAERIQLLQETSRLKDEFLASLSHELRTPLNAILGYARMLQAGIVAPEKQPRAIETIERNATSLTQIVEDVLDVSRIISGKMRLNVRVVDLAEAVRGALDAVAPAADAKGILVETTLEPGPSPVSGDPERLQQILWNLLSNAVKFTNRGGSVVVRLEHVDSHVNVTVSDTGIGIAPEFMPHVFERFRQADAGITRERGGLGLGLAIARQLVEMHGGSIDASSGGPGKGSTFRVTLPLTAGLQTGEAEEPVHPHVVHGPGAISIPNLHGLQVLAVDDEPDALSVVCEILEATGAQVMTARSAAEALSSLEAALPDILVADLGMPHMDGFELIARVRMHPEPRVREVPAVALTAYARSEDRAKTLRAGFSIHLAKPIDPAELLTTIAVLAGRHEAEEG
jgi:PAS domain S-box-containing protein